MSQDRQEMKAQQKGPGQHFGRGHAMGRPVEKAKDFKGTLKRLLTYLKPFRLQLLIVFTAAMLSTVFAIVSPKILGDATTILFDGMIGKMNNVAGAAIDFNAIKRILVILICLYAISAVFSYLQQYIMAGVAQRAVYNIRKEANEKLANLPIKYHDSRAYGETLSRVVNDVDNISSTLQQSLTQLITAVVTIIGVIVMMLLISPLLTVIVLLTLPLSIIVTIGVAKKSQYYFKGQQKSLGELNGHVEEMFTGHTVVKAFNQEEKAITEFNTINERLYNSGWRAQFISGIIMPLMSFVGNLGYVLICIVGGLSVAKGTLQIGHVQAFIQYARQFTQPITQVANIANIIQSTIASAERVFEVIDAEEETAEHVETAQSIETVHSIKFENVRFGYEQNNPLIKNLNLDVCKGETIAIVGPTGAGKTTLVNLLMRFYEIDGGKIMINDIDTRDMSRVELRSLFGMVLQETWLFNGTIKENIAYGRENVTEAEIIAAAKSAHADYFIRTLPDGYDTVLNEEASNISQGQKQLLTIARALLANPKILILDEATSSVDTRTEINIQSGLEQLMKDRTSFVIAHRLSTIRNADLILVMDKGAVIEQGDHDELLEKDGLYAELYYSQFHGNFKN